MADEAMNVLDASKTIVGLMNNSATESEPTNEAAPQESNEAPAEETVNPSDVPYADIERDADATTETVEAQDEAQEDIQNESSEEPTYQVKVQGQTMEVTLDELLQGYQREADYTRSKQDLSLEKSRLDQTLQRSQSEINQKLAKLNDLNSAAQAQLQQEYANIDFERLYEDDPVEASKLEHKMRKRADNLQRIHYETQQAQQQELARFVQDEQSKMLTLIPEFNDPNKASALRNDMKGYLQRQGFKDQEINSIYDSRQVMLIRDALAYDKIRRANPKVKKKVVNAPKVVKSGTPKTAAEQNAQLRKDKLNRLKKSGGVRDAAKVFRDFL
tara:strand:+ start:8803 stop:9792 length:990 start_codon:yes stop_codon:yes gene_type:complete